MCQQGSELSLGILIILVALRPQFISRISEKRMTKYLSHARLVSIQLEQIAYSSHGTLFGSFSWVYAASSRKWDDVPSCRSDWAVKAKRTRLLFISMMGP